MVPHRTVKIAAVNGAAVVTIHGIRSKSVGPTSSDLHIAADMENSGVTDTAAKLITGVCCTAVPDFCRAGQGGGSLVADTAAHSIRAHLSRYCHTARNAAAGHSECAVFSHIHAAALRLHSFYSGRTAHNIAAVHGKLAATFYIHAAAGNDVPVDVARATGNDTTVYGFGAGGFIQHPKAFGVWGEFMLRTGSAVDKG